MAETSLPLIKYGHLVARADRAQTAYEESVIGESMQEFSQLQTYRATFAAQWEEVAQLVLPSHRNTFYFGNRNTPGDKKTQQQVDATAMMALHRFGAILDSLLTPRNSLWHGLESELPELRKDRAVRMYFEEVTRILFQYRYAPIGNFSSQNQQVYQSLGAFGTGNMLVDQAYSPSGAPLQALRYKALPIGEMFLRENHQGLVDGFIRWFRLTALQAYQKWGDAIPQALVPALIQNSQEPFDFLHRVCPRSDYDPERIDMKGKLFGSYYISCTGDALISEGGYHELPIASTRYDQAPGETYGRSPAMMVLPAIKTLNAEKTVFLKQGHKAADPVLLTYDDGLVDFKTRPGAINSGGMSAEGRPLIGVLPTGDIQVTKEMMDEERALINDAFLVNLFQILTETPTMTATEVIERTNEKGILLAPTVGRQQSEYLGPMIDRELSVLSQMNLLPPMPQVLREARGQYQVQYTSPLSRAQRAQDVSGAMRTIEIATNVASVTQDPSVFDSFNFDVMIPEAGIINGMPVSWTATDEEIAAKKQARAKQAQAQQDIQAAPAAAAMVKAQVAAKQAGAK